jgi:hypothetical protein
LGRGSSTLDRDQPFQSTVLAAVSADFGKLSTPRAYLARMLVFVVLAGLITFVIYQQVYRAFMANPVLNAVIMIVLLLGVAYGFQQVIRIFGEVRWVNSLRRSADGFVTGNPPVLLAPVATLLGEKAGRQTISTTTLRSVLDSVGARLDEARDVSRYLTGLLVFLGLLGTFWGLIETVSAVGDVIQKLPVDGQTQALFGELKSGLAAPLAGMGISFSSSLFGLAGSLILGFLDLQAGQAQSRFYYELEDWLSTTATDITPQDTGVQGADIRAALDRLSRSMQEAGVKSGNPQAITNLADGIQQLVIHMRNEQQMIRDWVDAQASNQGEIRKLLERLAREPAGR